MVYPPSVSFYSQEWGQSQALILWWGKLTVIDAAVGAVVAIRIHYRFQRTIWPSAPGAIILCGNLWKRNNSKKERKLKEEYEEPSHSIE